MKKIVFCFLVLLLLLTTCEIICKIKYPKNIKPIDWENYNDVHTVYWNYHSPCDKANNADIGKEIKISGWKAWSADLFSLCDDPKYAFEDLGHTAAFPVVTVRCDLPDFKTKLDTSDLTKKCFIKGKIHLNYEKMPKGCKIFPTIQIMNIDDIYFK